MAKKVQAMLKLQVPAAKAAPSQQLGTALGPQGVNIMDFCKQFNARTSKDPEGMVTPVVITVYSEEVYTQRLAKAREELAAKVEYMDSLGMR